jgi:cell division inhibitor SulA
MAAASPTPQVAGVWRADQLGHSTLAGLASGFAQLDAQLPGGGWPIGLPTELIAREPGIGELRLLVPVLRQLTRERKVVILLGPPHVPYAPALASFGIELDYLIVVQAVQAADRLWAVEQILRSASFGALLAWLPQGRTRPEHLRRMQLAAQGARGPIFLFRDLPAQFEASPAPLRLLLLPRPQQQISVQILKRRGPLLARALTLDLPQSPNTLRPGRTVRSGWPAVAAPVTPHFPCSKSSPIARPSAQRSLLERRPPPVWAVVLLLAEAVPWLSPDPPRARGTFPSRLQPAEAAVLAWAEAPRRCLPVLLARAAGGAPPPLAVAACQH